MAKKMLEVNQLTTKYITRQGEDVYSVDHVSLDIEEVAAMHPRYFYGDVRTYIEQYQPDLVLWIYSEVQVGPNNALVYGIVN